MVEQESIEAERNLANGFFAWLQATNEELVPPLNQRAKNVLSQLSVDLDDLPQVRTLVNSFESHAVLPIRLYLSGFDDTVVRQLDEGKVFDAVWGQFIARCNELFPQNIAVVDEELPTVETSSVDVEQVLSQVEPTPRKNTVPQGRAG
jgi:antitoxin component of RelBE/YafQ-DinJ toxin-antitoxin module